MIEEALYYTEVRYVPNIKESNATKSIPRILHQFYAQHQFSEINPLPKQLQIYSDTWKKNHLTWDYIFWSNALNRKLVQESYSWFLDVYDELPTELMKSDVALYMYMHKFGGVYVDLNMESIKPLDDFLLGESLILGQVGAHITVNYDHSIPNAFIASIPNHSFWIYCLLDIMYSLNSSLKYKSFWWHVNSESITGPGMLYRVFSVYSSLPSNERELIGIARSDVFYPYNWNEETKIYHGICDRQKSTFNQQRCKYLVLTNNSLAITYWTHSEERHSSGVLKKI